MTISQKNSLHNLRIISFDCVEIAGIEAFLSLKIKIKINFVHFEISKTAILTLLEALTFALLENVILEECLKFTKIKIQIL